MHNVPVALPEVIAVLIQACIIYNTSYNVLLGQPFGAFLCTKSNNWPDEQEFITTHYPNINIVITIPTCVQGEHPVPL